MKKRSCLYFIIFFRRIRIIRIIHLSQIVLQFIVPVILSFSPLVLNAAPIKRQSAPYQSNESYTNYILKTGETVQDVAKRYHMTLKQLQEFNIKNHRHFKQEFTHLGVGTSLYVPVEGKKSPLHNENKNEALIANSVQELSMLAQSDNVEKSAKSLVTNKALAEVNGYVSNWLNNYGKVQVQLSDNREFQGAQLDGLFPLHETPDWLFFTQLGIRNSDDRWTTNIGLGERYFSDAWMFGSNIFYDEDLTGHHYRLGLGLEYWRDNLKLALNGYQRLSDWKQSTDLQQYLARPANGFDVDVQSWLPAYPQLGGELKFEQYYGDKVGLFSNNEDDLQRNPYALTANLNYTPIPLVTASLGYKAGHHKHDSMVSISLNYQFGQSWEKQIDPQQVSLSRTLMGQRHDLVQRNNNIVLEYKKKQTLSVSLAPNLSGMIQQSVNTQLQVNHASPIKDIIWGGDFTKQDITQVDGQYQLTLPNYQPGKDHYLLTVEVIDTDGNHSNVATSEVTVLTPSGKVAAESNLLPEYSETKIDVSLVDPTTNEPITEQANRLSANVALKVERATAKRDSETGPSIDSTWTETSPGQYSAAFHSGSQTGTATVNVSYGDFVLGGAEINIESLPVPVIGHSAIHVMKTQLKANDQDSADICLRLADKDDQLLSGMAPEITLMPNDKLNFSRVSSIPADYSGCDKPGYYNYLATVKSVNYGSGVFNVVMGLSNDSAFSLTSDPITFIQVPDINKSSFTCSVADCAIESDNQDAATITLTVLDANGHPVSHLGNQLTFAIDHKENVNMTPVEETPANSGHYEAKVTGTYIGHAVVTANINDNQALNTQLADKTQTVTFVAPIPTQGQLDYENGKTSLNADGKDHTNVIVTLSNKNHYPIKQLNHFTLIKANQDDANVTIGTVSPRDAEHGIYNVPLTASDNVGSDHFTLKAQYNSADFPATSPLTIRYAYVEPIDWSKSTFKFDNTDDTTIVLPSWKDHVKTATATLEVRDSTGKLISGLYNEDPRLNHLTFDTAQDEIIQGVTVVPSSDGDSYRVTIGEKNPLEDGMSGHEAKITAKVDENAGSSLSVYLQGERFMKVRVPGGGSRGDWATYGDGKTDTPFPETGFSGAQFQVVPQQASVNYTFSYKGPEEIIDEVNNSGMVKLMGSDTPLKPDSSSVEIIATPTNPKAADVEVHRFKIAYWFFEGTHDDVGDMPDLNKANKFCQKKEGSAVVPELERMLSNVKPTGRVKVSPNDQAPALLSEWGDGQLFRDGNQNGWYTSSVEGCNSSPAGFCSFMMTATSDGSSSFSQVVIGDGNPQSPQNSNDINWVNYSRDTDNVYPVCMFAL